MPCSGVRGSVVCPALFVARPTAASSSRLLEVGLEKRKAELLSIPEVDRTPSEQTEIAAVEAELASLLPPNPAAPTRYRVLNEVPENWIPFIPIHVAGSVREVQLQRALAAAGVTRVVVNYLALHSAARAARRPHEVDDRHHD